MASQNEASIWVVSTNSREKNTAEPVQLGTPPALFRFFYLPIRFPCRTGL
jgi:hypothetical protein